MTPASIRLCSLCVAASFASEPGDLLDLQSFHDGGGLPPAWTAVTVRGQRPPNFTLQDSGGHRFLRVAGTRTAGWIVNRLSSPVPPSPTRLAVSWRVLVAPAGADLRVAAQDDAALRVFVVFATHGFVPRIPRALFYSSGTLEPVGYSRSSFQSRALHVLRLEPSTASRMWQQSELDPFADYQRLWGGQTPSVVAVGLMQDSDQTGAAATVDVRMLAWTAFPSHGARPPVAPSENVMAATLSPNVQVDAPASIQLAIEGNPVLDLWRR